jgi:UDP-glucose 4-epimerase
MRVLVIGGAGYIGSHMVKLLGQKDCMVTSLDDLSSGHRDAVLYGNFVQGNFGDPAVLESVLSHGFDAVMHFTSFIQVGESMQLPENIIATTSLIPWHLWVLCARMGLKISFFHPLLPPLASRSTHLSMRIIRSYLSTLMGERN